MRSVACDIATHMAAPTMIAATIESAAFHSERLCNHDQQGNANERPCPTTVTSFVRPMAFGQDDASHPDPQRAEQRHRDAAAQADGVNRGHGHDPEQDNGADDGQIQKLDRHLFIGSACRNLGPLSAST